MDKYVLNAYHSWKNLSPGDQVVSSFGIWDQRFFCISSGSWGGLYMVAQYCVATYILCIAETLWLNFKRDTSTMQVAVTGSPNAQRRGECISIASFKFAFGGLRLGKSWNMDKSLAIEFVILSICFCSCSMSLKNLPCSHEGDFKHCGYAPCNRFTAVRCTWPIGGVVVVSPATLGDHNNHWDACFYVRWDTRVCADIWHIYIWYM